ncbi:MAG: DUF4360 domain-containing protein [Caulobacterales bacterium]|nr:DUF4360 domain-containing protein [Caulobacterales bacterium]
MKRSTALVALTILAVASAAAAQGRPTAPRRGVALPVQPSACPAGSYSVVTSPDGTSVSVLFHNFSVETARVGQSARATCRIQVPLAVPAGYSLGLTSVDYRGFAQLSQQQAGEVSVDYEVGRGNRAPHFQRRIQGGHDGDFAFTDRLPPGRLRAVGCGARGTPRPILGIDATLTLTDSGSGQQAMMALDSADQAVTGALNYRFESRMCPRGGRMTSTAEITSE